MTNILSTQKDSSLLHLGESILSLDYIEEDGLLAQDMKHFTQFYQHTARSPEKGKKKAFLTYFIGATIIFILSVIGFFSASYPSYDKFYMQNFQAKIIKSNTPYFSTQNECLLLFVDRDASDGEQQVQREYCKKLFSIGTKEPSH